MFTVSELIEELSKSKYPENAEVVYVTELIKDEDHEIARIEYDGKVVRLRETYY